MSHFNFLFLNKRLSKPSASLILLLATWFFLVAPRIVYFGFYHDDWSSIAMPVDRSSDLIHLLRLDPARPLYLGILYLLRPMLNTNVEIWQFLLALIHLLSAIAIRSTVSLMFAEDRSEDGKLIGSVAGILWLVFPWSLGYSAWTIMLPPNLAMLFTICAFLVLLKPKINMRKVNLAVFMLAISWLIYEATWMFWLPFAIFLIFRSINKQEPTRYAIQFFIRAMLVQLLFIAWNRYASGSIHSKHFSENLISTLEINLNLFVSQLLPSLVGKEFIGTSLILLIGCMFLNLKESMKSPSSWLYPFIIILGIAASISIYALAGYAIEWTGLFSRVTLPISFWLVLLFSSVFALAWNGSRLMIKMILIVSVAGCLLPLGASLIKQSILWKDAWQDQMQIINTLPQSVVDLANPNSLILFDVPRGTAPVYTFSAFWDISSVVALRMQNSFKIDKPHAYATVARRDEWRTAWDGKMLKQYWCSNPTVAVWGLEASQVYLWKYPNKEASEVFAPFEYGCDSEKDR